MTTRYLFTRDSFCSSGVTVSISSVAAVGDDRTSAGSRNRHSRVLPSSFLVRMAMRVSRARWFSFLRRVFHYQNGSRSDLGSNPFNSGTWMITELAALVLQIIVTTYTLANSIDERPLWPMRMWVFGYDFGCVLSLFLLFWRYSQSQTQAAIDGFSVSGTEQQRSNEEPSRSWQLIHKLRTCLELFFAIWFVMGNVWVFGSRYGSFRRAPKLQLICISILAWNAIGYSFPFILFVLLCCCVPLISSTLGYNMNVGSMDRGASDEQLSDLPSWNYNAVEHGKSGLDTHDKPECCICLGKYKESDEIRELPCSHIFHLTCVDQWLRIISCCPLCKQELEK